MSVLDTLAKATAVQRTVKLCTDGSALTRWESLRDELDAAVNGRHASLEQDIAAERIEDLEAARDAVKASEVAFEIQPMEWTERLTLQAQHPPRENHLADLQRGYNVDTFLPELIRQSCIAVTGADGDRETEIPAATWDHLLGNPDAEPRIKPVFNLRQIEDLQTAAVSANDGRIVVPPSARSLLMSRDSGTSSTSPSPGTSPRSGGAAGSPRGSRKSSATKRAPSKGKSRAS